MVDTSESARQRRKRHEQAEKNARHKQKNQKEREDKRHRHVIASTQALAVLLPVPPAPAQMPTAPLFAKKCTTFQSYDPRGRCFKYDPNSPPVNRRGETLMLYNGKWLTEKQIARHTALKTSLRKLLDASATP